MTHEQHEKHHFEFDYEWNENPCPHASCESETMGWSTTALYQHCHKNHI